MNLGRIIVIQYLKVLFTAFTSKQNGYSYSACTHAKN